MKPPIMIEVIHSEAYANVQLCRKTAAELFKQKIAPLPFASSTRELRVVLDALKKRNTEPSIFIVNTFWAEELLAEIDPLLGKLPVLFFMRQIYAEPNATSMETKKNTLATLIKMQPRPSCVWTYGSKTGDEVVGRLLPRLIKFLQGGNFRGIDEAASFSLHSNFAPQMIVASASGTLPAIRMAAPDLSVAGVIGSGLTPAIAGLRGLIEQLGLSTLLMMFEMEKKTGILQLSRDQETGRVLFRAGRVVYADLNTSQLAPENSKGAEAVYYLLTWSTGLFDFTQQDVPVEDQVNAPTTSLLMEAARRMDDQSK